MKRGITAIIILTVCIVFAITINLTLEHKVQSIYSLAQSVTSDKKSVYILEKKWKRELIYFELFIDHSYFENIDKKIRKLQYLEGEAYHNTCTETLIDLIEFKEHLSFSLQNIL